MNLESPATERQQSHQSIVATSLAMAPTRTRTVKNKHSAAKAGAGGGGGKGGAKRSATDGVSKPRSGKPKSGPPQAQQLKEKNRALLQKKPKKKTYTEAELNIPTLNMVTPVGVVKPKGKKKGKVFVDDTVCANLEPLLSDPGEFIETQTC